jgi:hypothetical protein
MHFASVVPVFAVSVGGYRRYAALLTHACAWESVVLPALTRGGGLEVLLRMVRAHDGSALARDGLLHIIARVAKVALVGLQSSSQAWRVVFEGAWLKERCMVSHACFLFVPRPAPPKMLWPRPAHCWRMVHRDWCRLCSACNRLPLSSAQGTRMQPLGVAPWA